MNIFVAGIHGVGKTYLAGRLPPGSGLLHTSASKLIREEKAQPSWGVDKRVTDIDDNQVVLAAAVARRNAEGTALLLDGHFVLLDKDRNLVSLGPDVFRTLNLTAVVLIEGAVDVVSGRLSARDGVQWETTFIERFMTAERTQAQSVCTDLKIPLHVLSSPSDLEFAAAIRLPPHE